MVFSSLYFSFKKYILIFNEDLNIFSIKVNHLSIISQYLKFNSSFSSNNFAKLLKLLFILNYLINYTFFYRKYKFININLYFLDNLLIFYRVKIFTNFFLHLIRLNLLFEHFTTVYNLLSFDSKYSFVLLNKKQFLGE